MLQAAKYNWIQVPAHLYYYSNLQLSKVVNALRYRFSKDGIVYGIRCLVTDKMYIGSTLDSVGRFNKHLIAHDSCADLQAAIKLYGLSKFKVYIFESLTFPHSPLLPPSGRQALFC